MKKLGILAACLVAWTSSAYARDLDKGTATDDGSGNPFWVLRNFVPGCPEVYFKFTNTTGSSFVVEYISVFLAEPGTPPPGTEPPPSSGCSGPSVIVGEMLRTSVSGSRHLDATTSQTPLDITLGDCESILIRVSNASPDLIHTVILGTNLPHGTIIGELEIWDGDCND